nr:DNA cytosine methyltransferase [Streptococcus sp. Marseille-Q5619]
MKFLDLFAGIGGFRLGMESAGHECVGFCEIDKYARASYKAIHNTEGEIEPDFRIRKLTPRECWRLQGFPDWAFDKAQEVNSNSQLYKQAGNSVTVNVIAAIAKELK